MDVKVGRNEWQYKITYVDSEGNQIGGLQTGYLKSGDETDLNFDDTVYEIARSNDVTYLNCKSSDVYVSWVDNTLKLKSRQDVEIMIELTRIKTKE